MMKKILLLFILTCSGVGSAFAQFDNSAWGNTLNGNASGSGGFVTIYSSLKPVDGTGSFTAVKVPSSNNYIEDVNISAWIATVPLSKRLKAKAGEPFTIDVHTAGYAGTNFANPSVGSPYWTVDTSDVYFPTTNPKMPNGIGQNGDASKYSEFFSWEQKFPLNYYAPGNVNYEGYKKEFVFTKGSTEGYIVFRLVENEYKDFTGFGVAFPTGFSHTTVLLIPFVVEGPVERNTPVLGTITKPQIPYTVIHRPPGDESSATIVSTQKTCRNIQESVATTESNTGRGSIKLGTKETVGIVLAVDVEIYAKISAKLGTGSMDIRTREKESCVEVTNEFTLESLVDDNVTSDVFVGYGLDLYYGIWRNLSIVNGAIAYDTSLVYAPVDGTIRQFALSEDGIRDDIATQQALLNSAPDEKSRARAKHQIDAWNAVLAKNEENKLLATEVLDAGKIFEAGIPLTVTKGVTYSQTASIETSSYIEGSFDLEFLVDIAGSGWSAGYEYQSRTEYGALATNSTDSSTILTYRLADGDATNFNGILRRDKFVVDILRDPMFGTPVFRLVELGTKSSCPYEGGYQRDQPAFEFVGLGGAKVSTKNNVTIGQVANFKIDLRNNSNEPRIYTLGVKTGSLPNNLEVKANGNTNITSAPTSIEVPANGCLCGFDIDVIRPQADSPTSISNIELEWYSACESDIRDSLIINVNWATPPPPVLGALPDPNPSRNIYVCGAVPPIPLNASCSAGTKPYWYKSATGGLPLDPIETNSITDNNAADGDEYYVSCQSPNYISPRSFFGKVVFHSSPVVITESGPLSFCAPGSVTFNSYADNNNKVLSLVKANNQYVEVPHSNSLNLSTSFTFEAWVNYAGENIAIIDKGNYDFLWMINANGNANKLGYFERGIGWKYSNDAVPENTWTHVALTLQSGVLRFYINGVESGYGFLSSAFQDNLPMNIGRQQPSSCQCNHFNGNMDELRLWNVAKSQAEIQASMKIGVPVNSAGLVAYYKFNEASGTSVFDATSNNNNGVLMNGASRQTAITVPFNELNVSWAPLNTTASSFTVTTSGTYTASVNYGIGCSTSVNKTVSVNSNAALVSLSSPNDDIASTIITKTASSSNGKIVATNKITGTAKVNYQAKSLELNAGFIAESGTVFSAEIGGCPN